VSRQLASLEAAGLVSRDDNDYVAGPALVRLAHRVVGRHPLPRLARPLLADVAAATGETCVLAVPHEDRALYVAAADGTRTLRVTGWLGRDVPRAGSAVGRALAGEVAPGAATVGRDTVEEGVTGVSSAVRDTAGTVVAAISLLGPSFRLEGDALEQATTLVAGAAVDLGALLGA
jgi:DNA-binding IclR family transcriptional regulator